MRHTVAYTSFITSAYLNLAGMLPAFQGQSRHELHDPLDFFRKEGWRGVT